MSASPFAKPIRGPLPRVEIRSRKIFQALKAVPGDVGGRLLFPLNFGHGVILDPVAPHYLVDRGERVVFP
jgi:hypothetical protein